MDPDDVTNIFAVTLAVSIVAAIAAAAHPTRRRDLARVAPVLATITAIGATLGSLYMSEVANYVPCTLCWYQRIAMYPIALVMVVSLAVRDRGALRAALALSVTGLAVSIYHVQLQLFPDQSSNSCEITNPCTAKWVEAFGFITIPQMAGASFALIALVSVIGLRAHAEPAEDSDGPVAE